jgi:hypothetical protein
VEKDLDTRKEIDRWHFVLRKKHDLAFPCFGDRVHGVTLSGRLLSELSDLRMYHIECGALHSKLFLTT